MYSDGCDICNETFVLYLYFFDLETMTFVITQFMVTDVVLSGHCSLKIIIIAVLLYHDH